MHTERGFDRLVNFSDAVVAIAITLLILPLVDSASELGQMTFDELLAKDGMKLLVFVISFAVIGRFWLAHHRLYENIVDYSRPLLWVNLLWLLSIVFLPFPTELLAASGSNNGATTTLYVGTMLLTSATGTWQQWILKRNPALQAESVRGSVTVLTAASASALMLVVFLVTIVAPGLGLWSLLLLGFTGVVQRLTSRWVKRRNNGVDPE